MRLRNSLAFILLLTAPLLWAADPPPAKKKTKKFSVQELLQKAGGSSQQTTSVAGVRGLDETSGDVDTKARDYAAIDRLDTVVVHDNELQAFREEGKLR